MMKSTKRVFGSNDVSRVAIRTSYIRPKDKTGDTLEEKRQNMQAALSPQTQLEMGEDYFRRIGVEFDGEVSLHHSDLDVSGFKIPWRKRPEIMKHYEDAKKGLYHHLGFYTLSRAGRDLRDTLDMIYEFEKVGVTVHGIRENIISSNPEDIAKMQMWLVFAEQQARDISAYIKDNVLTRAKRGDINGRYPLLWLRSLGEGQYEVIPEMEYAIRRMIDLRKSANGYQKIAKAMNNEGLRTLNGKLWDPGKIWKYLSPTYIDSMTGTAFLNRDLPIDHEEHVRIPNAFPRILSDEEAEEIRAFQALYKDVPLKSNIPNGGTWKENNQKVQRVGRVRADSKYLLASVAYCAKCGAKLLSMQHGEDRPNKRAYNCTHCSIVPKEGAVSEDGGHQIVADSLEDGVLRVIRHVLKEPPPPTDKPVLRRPKKTRTSATVDEQMKYLLGIHMEGVLDKEHFEAKYKTLKEERDDLINHEAEAESPNTQVRNAAEKLLGEGDERITQGQLRQLILMLVKRVEAIIVIPSAYVRGPKTNLRRHARVTLNIEDTSGITTWLVPLYLPRYKNLKVLPFPDPMA